MMDGSDKLSVQLYGAECLCFDKNDFMKEEFNGDSFVRIHEATGGSGLETLRDDLGVYLKILRSAMIDLINRDYADFVNLSSNLTGLDHLIEGLKAPLGQLREEVLSVETLLNETIDSVASDLCQRHSTNEQKALLHRLTQIVTRLDRLESLLNSSRSKNIDGDDTISSGGDESSEEEGTLVDRLASEVNHLHFLVAQCHGAPLVNAFNPRVEAVCRFVETGLERRLREGMQTDNKPLLLRTLRTYASLGTIEHAHTQVRSMVKTALEEVISENALKSDPRGLDGMYCVVVKTVCELCKTLLQVSSGNGSDVVPGYSFLESSVWPEISYALETRTSHIFSPGNPAVFHKRYIESTEFLDKFEQLLDTKDRIQKFRQSPDYLRFMEQWNMPVYFQIRYKEIGIVLECALSGIGEGLLLKKSGVGTGGDEGGSKILVLSSTAAVLEALHKCWNNEIFLLPLVHRFWKLTLLILSRHRTWMQSTMDCISAKFGSTKYISSSSRKATKDLKEFSSETGSIESASSTEGGLKDSDGVAAKSSIAGSNGLNGANGNGEDIALHGFEAAVSLMSGIQHLADYLPKLFTQHILPHVTHLPVDKTIIMKDIILSECDKILNMNSTFMSTIVLGLHECMVLSLRQVGDTPRLYRRTNKACPQHQQNYVLCAVQQLRAFKSLCELRNANWSSNDIGRVMSDAVKLALVQYSSLTYEVLSSVYKMEESLKRLKRARDKGVVAGGETSGVLSDDDKIRLQIFLDVEYMGEQLSTLGIGLSEEFNKLFDMTSKAKEGNFVP